MIEAIAFGFVIRNILQPLRSVLRLKPNTRMTFWQDGASDERVESCFQCGIIGMPFFRFHPAFVNGKGRVIEQGLELVEGLGISGCQSKTVTTEQKALANRLTRYGVLRAGNDQHLART
jgi:hypothetical protein